MADYTLMELMAVTAAARSAMARLCLPAPACRCSARCWHNTPTRPTAASSSRRAPWPASSSTCLCQLATHARCRGAATAAGLSEIFAYTLQAGRVDVGFISGAQIDRYGNINSTSIGADHRHPKVRFPGSGGSADIACLARRTVIIAQHEKRRFPERVDYITSPGWLQGGDSRRQAGLRWGGPSVVVTTKAVLRFRPDSKEMYLASYHPGLTPQDIARRHRFSTGHGRRRRDHPAFAGGVAHPARESRPRAHLSRQVSCTFDEYRSVLC